MPEKGIGEEDIGEEDLRTELGLTVERGDELIRIIDSVMAQYTDDRGCMRMSHVLLHIASRKDINDVEKAACVFLLMCKAKEMVVPKTKNMNRSARVNKDTTPRIMDIDTEIAMGRVSGMIVAPEGIELADGYGYFDVYGKTNAEERSQRVL